MTLAAKSLDVPDEKRTFERGDLNVVTVAGVTIGRAVFNPGWRWSNDVKPIAGTESCEAPHTGYVISGQLHVQMDDGTSADLAPGDAFVISPGHDAWVLGEEPFVALDWSGTAVYGKPPPTGSPASSAASLEAETGETMTASTVMRAQREGQAFWMLGGLYEVKVSSEESDGVLTVMEMTTPEGMGPPPHTHPGSETVYVLEGRLRYHVGDETTEGGPGSVFHIPPGTKECFEPLAGGCRVLVVYTPGGIDKFFVEVGDPAQAREVPPPSDTPPDFERIISVGARYGMDIQPPG